MDVKETRATLAAHGYAEGHEETVILVKPDGVRLGIHSAIAALFAHNQLEVLHEQRVRMDASMALAIYRSHEGHPYFQELLQYVLSGDCKAYVLVGFNAAQRAHELVGATDPTQAARGTIRALFSSQYSSERSCENFVHAPDNLTEAVHEMRVLFGKYPYTPRTDD